MRMRFFVLSILALALASCSTAGGGTDKYTFSYRGAAPRDFGGAGADDQALVAAVTANFTGRGYYLGQEAQYSKAAGDFEHFDARPADFHTTDPVHVVSRSSSAAGESAELDGAILTLRLTRSIIEAVPGATADDPPMTRVVTLTYAGQLSAASLRSAAEQLAARPGDAALPATIESSWLLTGTRQGQPLALTFKQDLTAHSTHTSIPDISPPGGA
jgi:hypothetical protein